MFIDFLVLMYLVILSFIYLLTYLFIHLFIFFTYIFFYLLTPASHTEPIEPHLTPKEPSEQH